MKGIRTLFSSSWRLGEPEAAFGAGANGPEYFLGVPGSVDPDLDSRERAEGPVDHEALDRPEGLEPQDQPLVVKADGRREEFDRNKLLDGVRKACAKRPVSTEAIEELVGGIEGKLYSQGDGEVESRVIGEMVVEQLRELDDVAYVRFASVYRQFADVESLAEEIERLLERRRQEGEA